MSRPNVDTKRQLLTDLFSGKTDGLRRHKATSQRKASPYRWIVNDEVAGTVYGIGRDGSQHPLSINALTQVAPTTVWRIVDFSGGKRTPAVDEEF